MTVKRGHNRVRELREARGVTQVALAASSQLTRQSVGAIEAGRATPAVDVALRIARALDCQVEELFGTATVEQRVWAEPTATAMTGRAALAHIAGRWIAYPLEREGIRIAADGIVSARRGGSVEVEPVRSSAESRENLMIMGCSLALGLLADRLNARAGGGHFVWFARSSTRALEALSRRHAHIAGVHLVDAKTGEANITDVRRHASNTPVAVITLGRWEAGLLLPPGNPKRVRSVADLGRSRLRLVVREAGSGALRLLERELKRAGLPSRLAGNAALRASGHLEVAQAISFGAADVGVATRDAAMAFGLSFVPLAEERYDLVISRPDLADPRLQRLLDTMTTAAYRRELSALGYDVRACGDRVADIGAA